MDQIKESKIIDIDFENGIYCKFKFVKSVESSVYHIYIKYPKDIIENIKLKFWKNSDTFLFEDESLSKDVIEDVDKDVYEYSTSIRFINMEKSHQNVIFSLMIYRDKANYVFNETIDRYIQKLADLKKK